MPRKTALDVPITRARRTEFKTRAAGEDPVIEGYFVVFNQPYIIDDYCEEIVDPRAFDGCDMSDVRALIDHLPHLVLGRNTANTLDFNIDDTGLFATVRLNPADTDAMNLYARTQRGDVDQASFGFDEDWDGGGVAWSDLPNGRVRRTILHIKKLWEVSVCTFPAYEQTYVSARAREGEELRQQVIQARKNTLKRRFKHHA